MRKVLNKGFVKLDGTVGSTLLNTTFLFYIKAPIFVERAFHINEAGSFMVDRFSDEFYVPSKFVKDTWVGDSNLFPEADCNVFFTKLENYSKWSMNFYKKLVADGLSEEQARTILPASTYVTFFWTVSAQDLLAFCRQATQMEVNLYRDALLDYFKEKLPGYSL